MFSSYSTCHNYLLSIMDMWIPLQIASISMQGDDESGNEYRFFLFPLSFPLSGLI